MLPIGSVFGFAEGSETAVVNVLKHCSDKQEIEPINRASIWLAGKYCHKAHLLCSSIYYSGEIVAWKSQNGEN
ncbi:hypothetical protein VNO80_23835 [Phaseolus coccineus]|uniref:Uncharacterized protein n=1 Tax=Phaseolus coccineus TaxID=3886 RepID=A0AAN9QVX3_PHACN